MWWENAVIYQVYPRSFQDSDGDGIGDLRGIESRLDHIAGLGASAVWLSPFYTSPNADFGYDISDFESVDPAYGTLEDFDRLLEGAHARDLRVIVDFVGAHTSVEHPWFRARPDFYFWADEPPNNWRATFGGGAWQLDPVSGRYYLHSFFVEQADLNWRNPDVGAAMAGVLRFWRARGVDGFRLDAIDRLLKDPELRDDPPASRPFPLPLLDEYAELEHRHSLNAPDIGTALNEVRQAVGDAYLVGEAYLPTAELGPYLDSLDTVFGFEAMNAGPDAALLRRTIDAALGAGKLGWVLSNHDFQRFATRFGPSARAAALVFLMLPGPVFLFEGDELGTPDGPGVEPPRDRAGRDGFRHPMQWDDSANGGFTTGVPWLPTLDLAPGSVAEQEADSGSELHLFRRLIALRRELRSAEAHLVDSAQRTLVLQRGSYTVAVNFGREPAEHRIEGEVVIEAHPGDGAEPGLLPPHAGVITRR